MVVARVVGSGVSPDGRDIGEKLDSTHDYHLEASSAGCPLHNFE